MTAPKLTAWIKCRDQQPTLPGWYDVKWHGDRLCHGRLFFNGRTWRLGTMQSAFGTSITQFTNDAWRGLAEPPKDCAHNDQCGHEG